MPPRTRKAKAPTINTRVSNLVIVESPAKAKTIKKYLGKDFEVVASMGHVTDLAKGNDAIDKEHDFAPTYIVSPDKVAVVRALKQAAKTMKTVWLATDEDREGEAIARHLCRELKLDTEKTPRIVFHEITKHAIEHAVQHPRTLDIDLVNAQQARRVLDRLVGFDLSPVLWKKIKTGLSAGRVQSVAVKLLVERERAVQAFVTSSHFKVQGTFVTTDDALLQATLATTYDTVAAVDDLLGHLAKATFHIDAIEQKPGTKNPSPPFTTSSLQQAASSTLGYSVSKTMQLAQRLYEAGHITYMRTDSMHLSTQALGQAKEYITKTYGTTYSHTRNFTTKKKGAQEAHECIRPTLISKPVAGADEAEKRLYRLIRQRTVASQMATAKVKKTTMTIQASTISSPFVATGEVITFDGFLAVYDSKERGKESLLPQVAVGDVLQRTSIVASEQFTKAPARYTEASLVKKMEELGIGRPSTYAPTISTIQRRGYVEAGMSEGVPTPHRIASLDAKGMRWTEEVKRLGSTKGKLVPTSIGMVVTDFLQEHFPTIMDYQFTAKVEEEFDSIADGSLTWQHMIAQFYTPFEEQVQQVAKHAERASGERVLGKDPKTNKPVSVRIGRYGALVQIGEQGDDDIQYASLPHSMSIETVTLEDALTAFALPRALGEWKGVMIKANVGRFGPYVQWGSTFASLKQPDDAYSIAYDRARELIEEKIVKDKERTFHEFVYQDKPGKVMKSRWSNVIKRNRKTIKLAKGTDAAALTQQDIEAILEEATASKKKTSKKKASSKTTSAKKTSSKKSTATKTAKKKASSKKQKAPTRKTP